MDFLLEFNDFTNPDLLLEHYYDSVVNSYLGFPSKNALSSLIDYILRMIEEKQIKNIIKKDDKIGFTIRNRMFEINKSGFLTLYKIKTDKEEIKNIDVLKWIFGNEDEANDVLKKYYGGKVRSIGAKDTPALRDLNKKVGKRTDDEFLKNFKTPKSYNPRQIGVDIPIDKGLCLKIFNQISSI